MDHCFPVPASNRGFAASTQVQTCVPMRQLRRMKSVNQAGIRALPEDARGAMLFLVDHPVFRVSTVESLVSGISGGAIAVPVSEGRRGHPVLFSRDVFEEILDLDSHQGANVVVRRDPKRVVEVPVDDPGVLLDIDTPDAFERLSDA